MDNKKEEDSYLKKPIIDLTKEYQPYFYHANPPRNGSDDYEVNTGYYTHTDYETAQREQVTPIYHTGIGQTAASINRMDSTEHEDVSKLHKTTNHTNSSQFCRNSNKYRWHSQLRHKINHNRSSNQYKWRNPSLPYPRVNAQKAPWRYFNAPYYQTYSYYENDPNNEESTSKILQIYYSPKTTSTSEESDKHNVGYFKNRKWIRKKPETPNDKLNERK